jgi:hypothetical protein
MLLYWIILSLVLCKTCKKMLLFSIIDCVTQTYYVDETNTGDASASGSLAHPYASIDTAFAQYASYTSLNIILLGSSYTMTSTFVLTGVAGKNSLTITYIQ